MAKLIEGRQLYAVGSLDLAPVVPKPSAGSANPAAFQVSCKPLHMQSCQQQQLLPLPSALAPVVPKLTEVFDPADNRGNNG